MEDNLKRKRIGIVSPTCPYGHGGGHSARIRRLYEQLSKEHEVWYLFAYFRHGPANPLDREILGDRLLEYPQSLDWIRKLFGIVTRILRLRQQKYPDGKYRKLDFCAPAFLDRVVADYARKYEWDAVLVHYVLYSKAFRLLPKHVVKVIDTQDRFGDRFANLDKDQLLQWPWSLANMTPKEEGKGLERANSVLAIQKEEAEYFKSLGIKKCFTVPHLPEIDERDAERSFLVVPDPVLGYFGSSWAPNVHGLQWFIREVFPLVRERCPTCILKIWGSICKEIQESDGVILQGFVKDIRAEVTQCRLSVCPVFLGSGLNVKAVEAMGWGLPLVGTVRTYRGLDISGFPELQPVDEAEKLACRICDLLEDDNKLLSLSKTCFAFAEKLLNEGKASLEDAFSR